jgi:hypothetical protein
MGTMKDFEFLDLDEFLDVADGINTPFKFFEVEQLGDKTSINAKVWLRSAFISYYFESSKNEEIEKVKTRLAEHGFNRVKIKETAIPIK